MMVFFPLVHVPSHKHRWVLLQDNDPQTQQWLGEESSDSDSEDDDSDSQSDSDVSECSSKGDEMGVAKVKGVRSSKAGAASA